MNDGREVVEATLPLVQGSTLAIVETEKPAMHAWKFLMYTFALEDRSWVRLFGVTEGSDIRLSSFRGPR